MIGRRMRSKGGGPTLIVHDIVSDELVSCTWMNAMGKHRTETFAIAGLDDIDAPADAATPGAAHVGLGAPVVLAAAVQIVGLGADRLQALMHLPSWLRL